MRTLLKILLMTFIWLIRVAAAIVFATGMVGGIMYLNEKLNQYGTILIGG